MMPCGPSYKLQVFVDRRQLHHNREQCVLKVTSNQEYNTSSHTVCALLWCYIQYFYVIKNNQLVYSHPLVPRSQRAVVPRRIRTLFNTSSNVSVS